MSSTYCRESDLFRSLRIWGILALLLPQLACAEKSSSGRGNAGSESFSGTLPNSTGGSSPMGAGSGSGGSGSDGSGSGGSGSDGGGSSGSGSGGSTGGTGNNAGSGGTGMSNGAGGTNGDAGAGGQIIPTGTAHVFTGSTNGRLGAYTQSPADGSLTGAGSIDTGGQGLDFINVTANGRTVFVSRQSSVTAYSYDPASDAFAELDQSSTGGQGTHVAVSPNGNLVVVAHYNDGAITALPFTNGQFGAQQGFSPGANSHQVNFDARGEHVFIPCLGGNFIAQFDVNQANNTLSVSSVINVATPGGPRHMAFHKTASLAFALSENSSQVHVFDINVNSGLLERRDNGSVPTQEDGGDHWSSDIQITANGQFLYAVNRDPSQLVRFDVADNGDLTRAEAISLSGTVRSFAIDAAGEFLHVGGNAGTVVTYRIDADNGQLSQTASLGDLGDVNATITRNIGAP